LYNALQYRYLEVETVILYQRALFMVEHLLQAWVELAELFDKVVIEEAIEDGVRTGGGDTNKVTDHVGQHNVL
jgi:hypothetical protein